MKKVLKISALVLIIGILLITLVVVGINVYVANRYGSSIVKTEDLNECYEEDAADAVIVLGCAVWSGGDISPMLKDRLDTAIECFQTGSAKKILVTGDHQDYYDEVEHMKAYLTENGISEEDILMDYCGYSTYDSMYRAAEVYGIQSAIVVTQKYHLYRSLMIGDSWGIQVTGVSATMKHYTGAFYRELRECFATVKDLWNCIFRIRIS